MHDKAVEWKSSGEVVIRPLRERTEEYIYLEPQYGSNTQISRCLGRTSRWTVRESHFEPLGSSVIAMNRKQLSSRPALLINAIRLRYHDYTIIYMRFQVLMLL